jgi:hypothetical protein
MAGKNASPILKNRQGFAGPSLRARAKQASSNFVETLYWVASLGSQ